MHTVEKELQQPVPRPVRRSDRGAASVACGCVLVVIALALSAFYLSTALSLTLPIVIGRTARGVIVNRWVKGGSGKEASPRVRYAFVVGGSSYESGDSTGDPDTRANLLPGATIEVRYLPASPEWANFIEGRPSLGADLALSWLAGLIPLAATAVAVRAPRRRSRTERRLVEYGQPATATIVRKTLRIGGNVEVAYQFTLEDFVTGSQVLEGTGRFGYSGAMKLDEGDEATALFLPESPTVHALYASLGWESRPRDTILQLGV